MKSRSMHASKQVSKQPSSQTSKLASTQVTKQPSKEGHEERARKIFSKEGLREGTRGCALRTAKDAVSIPVLREL